jgi:DNA-binding NtrC family response regulator
METVLVIESENVLRTLYKEELEEEGYQIILVKDVKEALKEMEESVPNIIISDYQTPPTKSYITMLHEANRIKGIPVIIHTGYPLDLIEFNLCGEVEYMYKSSNLDGLKNKMREILD